MDINFRCLVYIGKFTRLYAEDFSTQNNGQASAITNGPVTLTLDLSKSSNDYKGYNIRCVSE